jgi:hypothetical protein
MSAECLRYTWTSPTLEQLPHAPAPGQSKQKQKKRQQEKGRVDGTGRVHALRTHRS